MSDMADDFLDDEQLAELIVRRDAEIERLRKFARRIWLADSSPAWAHDAAAKVLDEPSLAHGASEVDDECPCCNPAPDNYEVSFTEDPMFCKEAADEIDRLRAELALLADSGTGYSQQTLDAVTAERDRLRAERDEAREAAQEIRDYVELTGNPPILGWYARWPWLQNST